MDPVSALQFTMFATTYPSVKTAATNTNAHQVSIVVALMIEKRKLCQVVITPQPNRSKVFELQQSNQGYGESLGVKEAQKNAKQKYFIEPFWRNLILKFTL